MDDKHGYFWVSTITDDKKVIEVNKDLSLAVIFKGIENKYQATYWEEVKDS